MSGFGNGICILAIGAVLAVSGCASMQSTKSSSTYPVAVGKSFRDAPWAPEMVVIPAGTFVMGSTEAETTAEKRAPAAAAAAERPQHTVTLAQPLAVGKYHVTIGQFAKFLKDTGRPIPGDCHVVVDGKNVQRPDMSFANPGYAVTDDYPVNCVTPEDADAYAAWLSQKTGHQYRLLHEAEWEYAARAGTTTARWWKGGPEDQCKYLNGADLSYDRVVPGHDDINKSCDDGYPFSSPVGKFPPNPFGLYDMYGNLWQWTADCFVPNYNTASSNASAAVVQENCSIRAIRGGSWHNPYNTYRSATRSGLPLTMRASSVGFRVARVS